MSIRISGTGSALPEQILTNADLEKRVDTSDEWITDRTGIRQRRIARQETLASLAATAAGRALEDARKTAEDVELILAATCSPEDMLPCLACQVQDLLGAKQAVAFDLNAACAGFLFALRTAQAYVDSGFYKNAIVIGAEVLSHLVDWEDRTTCILFGDGAGAVFVEKAPGQEGILSMVQGSDGSRGGTLTCKKDGCIQMDGRAIYQFAVTQVPVCILQALEQASLTVDEVDLFVLHQANRRIIEAIARKLHVDPAKCPMNLERVGNMSSAAIPVLLDDLHKCGIIKRKQKIVLSGFGAGLTYGACVIDW